MAHDDWLHNMKRLDDTPDIFGQLGYGIAAFRLAGQAIPPTRNSVNMTSVREFAGEVFLDMRGVAGTGK